MRRNRAKAKSVTAIESTAPPVPALEALRRNLLYAMFGGVTGDDMRAIVAKQVEKAREGNDRSARLIIDMVQAGGGTPAVQVSQTVAVNQDNRQFKFLSDTRRIIANLLAGAGPQQTEGIVGTLHSPLDHTLRALDHPWFRREADAWLLTEKGRSEALEQNT